MASSERTPILVASEICCRVMPRFRRTVAKPRTLFFSFINSLSARTPVDSGAGTESVFVKAYYNITYASDKLHFYGHLPPAVWHVRPGRPGREGLGRCQSTKVNSA